MRPKLALFSIIAVMLVATSPAAFAWKPRTHVYLADQAVEDAIDDGQVIIFEIDSATNTFKKTPSGARKEIGRYNVDPRILEAVKNNRAQYRAGVLGPDAFPDILTGQQIIHPAKEVTPGESDVDLNPGGPGPNAWMKHLWTVAYGQDGTANSTPAARAFVAGFLAHAAGDMYGHTCVNYYTGDAFHFTPQPMNAVRHVVLEGYFDKRVPNPVFDSSIDGGVDDFIYRNMIDGRSGAVNGLLSGGNIGRTIAGNYSRLRNKLKNHVDDYDSKNAFQQAAAIAMDPLLPVKIEYEKRWIDDIDKGLKKLPKVSHRLAIALMFNSNGKADTDAAKEILDDYFKSHLLSMSGGPDFVGDALELMDKIVDTLGVKFIKDFFAEIKGKVIDYFVKQAIGVSVTDIKKYLEDPANQFNPVMDKPPLPNGHRTTREDFDKEELRLPPPGTGWIDFTAVPPAYNTVVMVKLSLVAKDEINRLMADLGSAEKLSEENAMLGFVATLDGSNQWRLNKEKMIVARYPAGYKRIFMKQNGENRYSLGARVALGPTGSRIILVKPNSAAAKAGLKVDDVITRIAGRVVGVSDNKTDVIGDTLWEATSSKVTVEYISDGSMKTVQITLDKE